MTLRLPLLAQTQVRKAINMANKGQLSGAGRTKGVVSNAHNPEVLLIRVGHWLWKWEKQANARYQPKEARIFGLAWVSVIEAKERYRVPLRESRIKNNETFRVKAAARLAEKRASKSS